MDEQESYCALIQKKIYKKTLASMRRAMHEGEQRRCASLLEFKNALLQNVLNVERLKIDQIIARAKVLVHDAQVRDPNNIAKVMHKLLRNIAEHTDIEITAHPDDMTHVKQALSEKEHGYIAVRAVMLQEDKSFDRGSLIIKANKSIIDAQVRTQLERARTILLQELRNNHGNTH